MPQMRPVLLIMSAVWGVVGFLGLTHAATLVLHPWKRRRYWKVRQAAR